MWCKSTECLKFTLKNVGTSGSQEDDKARDENGIDENDVDERSPEGDIK